MLKITKKTRLKPEEAVKKAAAFFEGVGLKITERSETSVSFEGGGGSVSVVTIREGETTSVDIETREWEYQVKKFLENLR